jgi:PAS domain S-box-containing protein
MSRQAPRVPHLAALLNQYQESIAASWAEMARDLPTSRYRDYPLEEVSSWLSQAVSAAIDALSTGSYEATETHLREISLSRLQMGFGISEVIEGLLLFQEATLPVILQAYSAGSGELHQALAALGTYLRFKTSRFGHLYAVAADAELRKSEERFRTVADFTYDWEYWLDAEGYYVYVSPSCERVTGYSADEFRRDPGLLEAIIHPDDSTLAVQHLREEPIEGSQVLPIVFRIITRSGAERWLEHVCQPVYDTNGDYLGRRGSNRDITERKQAQKAVEQHAKERAIVSERNRLARELHDSVTQTLYSISLHAEAASLALSAGNQDVVVSSLRKLQAMTHEAMRDLRMLIFELHPPLLQEEGLVAAVQARLAAVETRAGLQTEIRVEGPECLPLSTAEHLFWIAVEALNNVLKHANARKVTVDLSFHGPRVRMIISDDGLGFEPSKVKEGGGMGLRGMAERTERIQGDLEVTSVLGQGTTIRVNVEADQSGDNHEPIANSGLGR